MNRIDWPIECDASSFLVIVGLKGGEGGKDADKQKAVQERARQQEEAKHSILSQIMDQNARARCECKRN